MPAAKTQTQIHSTTQDFTDIYDIANDLVIMKDGSTALVLTVDAMNFGLLAEEEQDAVMYAYAGLLNSLNYSIQIVIRSQTKDATNYLNLLRDQEQAATSDTKRTFIREYREFVANLIRERNVLDKKFYIAIPATSLEMGLLPPSTVIPGVKKVDISTVERSVILDKAKNILEPKRDHLISQFGRLGLFARQLQTQEIIQLFYTSYNPEAAEGQQITDSRNYVTPLVEAATMSNFATPATAGTMVAPTPAAPQVAAAALAPTPAPLQPTSDVVPPNTALNNPIDIYAEPPAVVEIPLPVDAPMNQAPSMPPAVTIPPAAPNSAAATAATMPVTPFETPVYQAAPAVTPMPPAPTASIPPTPPMPSPMTAPQAPQSATVGITTPDTTLPPPTLPPIAEIK